MQLADLNSKPHGGNCIRNLIDRVIGVRLYPPPGSEHCKPLQLDQFHGPSHINDNHRNKNDKKFARFL